MRSNVPIDAPEIRRSNLGSCADEVTKYQERTGINIAHTIPIDVNFSLDVIDYNARLYRRATDMFVAR
jgi:hypothetical protein